MNVNSDESFLQEDQMKVVKPTRISVSLIASRNLSETIASGPSEDLVHHLMKLTHVRLDRENIGEIDNLEVLGPVTNLYLQQNAIKKIENLECLESLRFLMLAGNQIQKVENLLTLTDLQFLDLSDNKVDLLDVGELPRSLIILDMRGNPCSSSQDYRDQLVSALPKLQMLDGESLLPTNDDKGDEEETAGTYHQALDDVLQMSADLIKKSRQRLEMYNKDHQEHMVQIEETRAQSRQNMDPDSARETMPSRYY